jgi:hypothetical protein
MAGMEKDLTRRARRKRFDTETTEKGRDQLASLYGFCLDVLRVLCGDVFSVSSVLNLFSSLSGN